MKRDPPNLDTSTEKLDHPLNLASEQWLMGLEEEPHRNPAPYKNMAFA